MKKTKTAPKAAVASPAAVPVVEEKPLQGALIVSEALEPALGCAVQVPAARNPYLVYVGGLDVASHPTMISTARTVAFDLSGGQISDPRHFPWGLLRYPVVKALRSRLTARGLAPRTVNKALTLSRNIAKEAWLLGLIPHEEYERLRKVDNLKSVRLPVGRVVERDEIAKLLMVCCKDDSPMGMRDATVIAVLAGAGLREKEAVLLKQKDYDSATGDLRVHGKHHKERTAYLEAEYGLLLWRLYRMLGTNAVPETPLLPRLAPNGSLMLPVRSISTQAIHLLITKRAKEAGIKLFTPHDLRRSFITHQLARGVDPLRLARAVGHSSPTTTMIYDRRSAESDRRSIRGEKELPEALMRDVFFTVALGGGPVGEGTADLLDVPMRRLLDDAWRAPLRSLRAAKKGFVYSIRLGTIPLYVGRTSDVRTRMQEHCTIGNARGCGDLHDVLSRFPDETAQWTVRVWPDLALDRDLGAAEQMAIEIEHPCFNAALNRAPGPVPARYRKPDADNDPFKNNVTEDIGL